jgi:hypothetical protein
MPKLKSVRQPRVIYVSWHNGTFPVLGWVKQLRIELEPIDYDDYDSRLHKVVPRFEEGSAGTRADARSHRDATDFIAVATSEYIAEQKSQLATSESELAWAIQAAEISDRFALWYAPLQDLQLRRYDLGKVRLSEIEKLRSLRADPFPLKPPERVVRAIGEALRALLGHRLGDAAGIPPLAGDLVAGDSEG